MTTHTKPSQARAAVAAIGGLFELSFDTLRALGRRPFHWREALGQAWFLVTVAFVPTLLVALPFTVLVMLVCVVLIPVLFPF